jgi:hypothetical protein
LISLHCHTHPENIHPIHDRDRRRIRVRAHLRPILTATAAHLEIIAGRGVGIGGIGDPGDGDGVVDRGGDDRNVHVAEVDGSRYALRWLRRVGVVERRDVVHARIVLRTRGYGRARVLRSLRGRGRGTYRDGGGGADVDRTVADHGGADVPRVAPVVEERYVAVATSPYQISRWGKAD